ncbi:hypothetical protein ACFPOB_20615 [Bosea eneae]|uniref:Uncharacterized protein n=1 Tax=Bosea eneae TaxID=151454 RepID=A0ABW0IXD5_9HYPH
MSEGTISPWFPEQDRIRLAVLGKLIEECTELAGRAARCIIQGLDERDPATGRKNREELGREMSDVSACIETAERCHIGLRGLGRMADKRDGFRRWHELIRAGAPAGLPEDVARLVVAARIVAYSDQSAEALRELDKASEAFADRVAWDDEPIDEEGEEQVQS